MTTAVRWDPPLCGNSPLKVSPKHSTCVAASARGAPRICRSRRPDDDMAGVKVVMYLTDWCPYCARARGLLERKGVEFETINIDERPEARAEMMARSGRRSVPQIFIGDTHVGGCDDLDALAAAGRPGTLLKPGA